MSVRIRRVSDYRLATAMDLELFPSDEPIEDPDHHVWFVGFDGDTPVCYASFKLLGGTDAGTAFLSRCGVLESHRGQGLQKRLIKAREREARRQGATVMITYTVSWNAHSMNSLYSCGYRAYIPASKWGGEGAVYFSKPLA